MKKKKKNKQLEKNGFTLIELLAVIVILGLLMAIAIPSVTRYITESRRKTIVTSIDGYVRSVGAEVIDNNYGTMSDGKTLYYIPVSNKSEDSCATMEKGGQDPFGNWLKAYVVVHFNPDSFSYDYYFTFIDDAGYGMALTKIDEIATNGKDVKNPAPITLDNIDKQNLNGEKIKVLNASDCKAETATVTYTPPPKTFILVDDYGCGEVDHPWNTRYTYNFDEGMTLEDWVNSSYNTKHFVINTAWDGRICDRLSSTGGLCLTADKSTVIEEGKLYQMLMYASRMPMYRCF